MARQVIGCLCFAVFVVMASLLVPTTVFDRSVMGKVPYGLPLPFVWQSVDKLDPPSFPRSYTVMLPQEYPTWVSLTRLWLNVALVGAFGFVAHRSLRQRKARKGRTL